MSKTLQFDKALADYFSKFQLDEKGGRWRTCRFSGQKFYVRPEDIEFYKKIRVPLPTLLPKERIRRKLAFGNGYNLFRITSACSGKAIISQYPPSTPFKVYEHRTWFGEEWNPMEYAKSYEPGRSFFEQFRKLQLEVPRPSLSVDNTSVNSDYTNTSSCLKNCYLVFDSLQAEDSAYSLLLMSSRNCIDCFATFNSDNCYQCFESSKLYNCFFVEYARDCLDSAFLYDCRNCEHCFGCVNLRHKKYYFLNKPLSKEAYEEKIRAIRLGDRDVLEEWKRRFSEMASSAIRKENHNERAFASTGDYIKNSKNCFSCFYMIGSENTAYSVYSVKARDLYDVVGGSETEYSYESYGGVKNYGMKFSHGTDMSRDVEYCDFCINCRDCFGCVGLKNKSFCIFNTQYSEKDYWALVDAIKTKMLRDGEYGEFFPPELASVPYNISYATAYKGYDDIEIAARYGYHTEIIPETLQEAEGDMMDVKDLPCDIKEVGDEILDKIIWDSVHKKKFKYIKSELEFYRKYDLPLPWYHFSVRLADKRKKFGTIALEFYDRPCAKCGKIMHTPYTPDRPEKNIYCEACYLQEVV